MIPTFGDGTSANSRSKSANEVSICGIPPAVGMGGSLPWGATLTPADSATGATAPKRSTVRLHSSSRVGVPGGSRGLGEVGFNVDVKVAVSPSTGNPGMLADKAAVYRHGIEVLDAHHRNPELAAQLGGAAEVIDRPSGFGLAEVVRRDCRFRVVSALQPQAVAAQQVYDAPYRRAVRRTAALVEAGEDAELDVDELHADGAEKGEIAGSLQPLGADACCYAYHDFTPSGSQSVAAASANQSAGSPATDRSRAPRNPSISASFMGVERQPSPSLLTITPSSSRLLWSAANRPAGDAPRTELR